MAEEIKELSPELEFLVYVCVAVTDREYEEAIALFKDGVSELSKAKDRIPNSEMIKAFEFLAWIFESHLDSDFGIKLRNAAKPKEKLEARCSFCGKQKNEVSVLVAGYGAFICENCVETCNKVIAAQLGRTA